ncbi:MAG TPA: hypothetical protein DCY35_03750 [Prolixibacteraceae bacterium]|nr:hypothetical protein [Prolixibacteraceae bacterium]
MGLSGNTISINNNSYGGDYGRYHNHGVALQINGSQKQKKTSMSFHEQARDYIHRLLKLQKFMPKEYKRIDQVTVIQAMDTLEKYLDFYAYDTDQKMRTFWRKHRWRIKILLPRKEHSAFEKLLVEFERLDSYAASDMQADIWQSLVQSLNQH